MRFLPLLLLAAVAVAIDNFPRAPGHYPPEEMKNDVPQMPMSSYQQMMMSDSNAVEDYQFYYEKEASKPAPLGETKEGTRCTLL